MSRYLTSALYCLAVTGFAATGFAATGEAAEAVAYRLTDWKAMHFDDAGTAAQHLAAVKKLGCEARQEQHAGHTDVIYRSPKWQALELASDELAHHWEAWLKAAGFQTVHGHSADHAGAGHAGHPQGGHQHPGHTHPGHTHAGHGHAHGHAHAHGHQEQVAYRMAEWRTMSTGAQYAEYIALMKGLGCDVRGDGQADISVRCPQWKHMECPTHQTAQGWENWLRNAGFEVQHIH